MRKGFWIVFGLLVLGILIFIFWNREFEAKALYLSLLQWLERRGPEAALWIIGLQALQVVLAVPGPFFTLGAGFLFGTWAGGAVAVCGSTLGAAAAYWIARSFPESRGEYLRKSPKAAAMRRFIARGGWQVVLSTRLIPFFPFKLSNYFFGWMRFPFRPFFWGTFLGIIPVTMVSVSAGSLTANLADLMSGGNRIPPGRWLWSALSLALAGAILLYMGIKARKDWREGENQKEAG